MVQIIAVDNIDNTRELVSTQRGFYDVIPVEGTSHCVSVVAVLL
jgi:hypothetical protein